MLRSAASAIVAADRIEDDIGAGRPDRVLELLRKRLLGVAIESAGGIDDGLIRARLPRRLRLGVRRDRRDHARAKRLADFDRRNADAAGGAEHEQGLPA